MTIVGYFPYVSAGETITATGKYVMHRIYGRQFAVESFSTSLPEAADGIEKYLGGGFIKGVGPGLARRIVKRFGHDTFRIIEEEPERLSEVKGISSSLAENISQSVTALEGMREAFIFMLSFGIPAALCKRIYEKYGPNVYSLLRSNPYRLAEEIDGVGFKTADSIALKMGIDVDDRFRVRCGILYLLSEAAGEGHTYLPFEELSSKVEGLLKIEINDLEPYLLELQVAGRVMLIEKADTIEVYLRAFYYTEKDISLRIGALNLTTNLTRPEDRAPGLKRLKKVEKKIGFSLDKLQREAVFESNENGVLILTGGPGTGKTTTINALISFYEEENLTVLLAAPTGRAAKRIEEATGREARTIHRLLEYTGVPTKGNAPGSLSSYEGTDGGIGSLPYAGSGNGKGAGTTSGKGRFLRDEKNPLEADVIIIDEMSMVDIFLMDSLLKAITPGTRLILVGDYDQLPSVGAGNVLKDLVDSGAVKTVTLSHIFRQAAISDIVTNAHRINAGEYIDLAKKSKDFIFIRESRPETVLKNIEILLTEKLPGYVGCDPLEIQVLSPLKKGFLGVENLNIKLQDFLNPPHEGKTEISFGGTIYRSGDKVMQVKNDYDLEWIKYDSSGRVMEKGAGVFNGDMGRVINIDQDAGNFLVCFDEGRVVNYGMRDLTNIELSYAVTVHKSQGSEYPACIIPMYHGPKMLMNRNLLYTAVTRAKKCVVMVGLPEVFAQMEKNENEGKRYSGLKERLMERSHAGYVFSSEVSGM